MSHDAQDDGFALPSMYDHPMPRMPALQKGQTLKVVQTQVEVLSQGSIEPPQVAKIVAGPTGQEGVADRNLQEEHELSRAPLSMKDIIGTEEEDGEYFIQLMKRRLELILSIQNKWHMRACNQKHPRHVQVQQDITDFMRTVSQTFDQRFACRASQGSVKVRTKRTGPRQISNQ